MPVCSEFELTRKALHDASQNTLQPSNPGQSPPYDLWDNFFVKCWFKGNLAFLKGKVSIQKGYNGLIGSFSVIELIGLCFKISIYPYFIQSQALFQDQANSDRQQSSTSLSISKSPRIVHVKCRIMSDRFVTQYMLHHHLLGYPIPPFLIPPSPPLCLWFYIEL